MNSMGFFSIDVTPRGNDEELFAGVFTLTKLPAEVGAHLQRSETIAPRERGVDVSVSPQEGAFALSEQLEKAPGQPQAESKEMLALKRQAERSLPDWTTMASALSVAPGSQDDPAEERLATGFPGLRESSHRLQTYCHEAL